MPSENFFNKNYLTSLFTKSILHNLFKCFFSKSCLIPCTLFRNIYSETKYQLGLSPIYSKQGAPTSACPLDFIATPHPWKRKMGRTQGGGKCEQKHYLTILLHTSFLSSFSCQTVFPFLFCYNF